MDDGILPLEIARRGFANILSDGPDRHGRVREICLPEHAIIEQAGIEPGNRMTGANKLRHQNAAQISAMTRYQNTQ